MDQGMLEAFEMQGLLGTTEVLQQGSERQLFFAVSPKMVAF